MHTNNTLHAFIVKQKAAMQRRYLYKVAGLSLFLSTRVEECSVIHVSANLIGEM